MVERQEHLLSKPKRHVIPESVIFVDTETTQQKMNNSKIEHHLMLGVAIYTRFRQDRNTRTKDIFKFKCNADFWDYVSSKVLEKKVLYLISHNACFDFTVLEHITYLSKLGYRCVFVYDGGMRYIAKWRKNNHSIVILDNANWFAGKLEKWGKELNLPKLDMPEGIENEETWFQYCKRDTEILYQLHLWYTSFLSRNNLGGWKYTIASSAFTSFRHRFMYNRIYIPNDTDEQRIARESYHGGRTEVFKVGRYTQGLFYKLDINSMYPFVMREHEYPTCFDGYYDNPSLGQVESTIAKKAIIADCTLNTTIPYFCWKHNGRNVYPIGEFRTTLTSSEVLKALTNNWLIKVHSCSVYRKRSIFSDYVDFFYRVKQDAGEEGKPLLRSFAKLYLNSLYGKFGQRGFIDKVLAEDINCKMHAGPGISGTTGKRFYIRQVGHTILYSEKGAEGYNSFCAIASEVTGNARMMLYDLIIRAGRDNSFYCDTDSIIVNEKGYERLKHLLNDKLLGYIKVEGVSDIIEIVAPKHYLFAGKWTMKGVRKNAVKLSKNTYRQEIWPGYNTILQSGKEVYFNYYQTKTLNPTIISGMVNASGFVMPFTCVDNQLIS